MVLDSSSLAGSKRQRLVPKNTIPCVIINLKSVRSRTYTLYSCNFGLPASEFRSLFTPSDGEGTRLCILLGKNSILSEVFAHGRPVGIIL